MSDLKIFDRMESQVRGYIRSFPVLFTYAKGSILRDDTAKDYIDFFSGAGTLNYGHNNELFKAKLIDYVESDGVVHGLDMATSAKKAFLESVDQHLLKPRNWNYTLQFTGPTGTNAVEAALKLARQVTGRQNVISFTHGFHGVSCGALAATANKKFREAAGIQLHNITFMPYDGYLGPDVDTINYLERLLEDPSSGLEKPAAVIVETIQGEGGVNVANTRWLKALQQLCKEHGMLMIVDDIQVGCGRTGTFFSFEKAGIQPDIITLSKSLSGYGLPMSLVLMKPELDIWKPSAHNGTFRGNNLAFVTATAALDHYWQDAEFSKQIQSKEVLVRDWLENIVHSYPGSGLSVRGRGLIQGLVAPQGSDIATQIASRAFEKGLVIETSGAKDEVVKLLPALTIEPELLKKGLNILEQSVAEVMAQTPQTAKILKLGAS
ncbi:diaminobutyrate--2-oxoglutarate transaminase [Paenalcaligenes faecalis]|uniref:diaminobutyrate--2-oxoglutarate transaminase n=1 Tax=Paenalcaligenes faecalis TaxID=2980099 RepID=UPI0022B9D44E|nr:diaminobutyrate--2-oxoglutarate transaminase [Paenalcaligenes faecalis]